MSCSQLNCSQCSHLLCEPIMMDNSEEVIDLTESFTLVDHCNLADEIIVIDTDESFNSPAKSSPKPSKKRKKPSIGKKSVSLANHQPINDLTLQKRSSLNKFGQCPICWEELGKNPLASTKCGHVYCLKCLENALRLGKRCPSCRTALKGSAAYHPLYLNSH